MTSYLQRQRKGDLQEMAGIAGVQNANGMLKEDLVSALQSRLNANPAEFQKIPALKEYYERGGSPTKQRASAASAAEGDAPKPRRRKTVKKEELESPEDDSAESKSLVKTPGRAVQKAAEQASERITFPPSPAVVADAIERQTSIVTSKVGALVDRSGASEVAEWARELLSSVHAIEAVVALLEAFGLQRQTLPWTTTVRVPPIRFISRTDSVIALPNLFEILTARFWSTTLLWLSTSALVPAMLGYLFNLSLHTRRGTASTRHSTAARHSQHSVDPLAFNIAKALISWLVYSQGIRFGFIANETVDRVNLAVFGGYQGLLIGASIGAVASLYDAVLRK